MCERLRPARPAGLHCYDIFAGAGAVAELVDEEPGTYLLTDFLVRSFRRTVLAELAWTATPSCGPTTSATTGAWSGWPRTRPATCAARPGNR